MLRGPDFSPAPLSPTRQGRRQNAGGETSTRGSGYALKIPSSSTLTARRAKTAPAAVGSYSLRSTTQRWKAPSRASSGTHVVPRTPDQQCRIVVCLDNSAAIRAIRGSPSISSQAAAEKFAEAAARHGDVRTRWCPGHTGIAGNERADQLAKEGCRALGPDRPPTYANIKRQAKAAARRDFQDWWAAGAPSSYKSLGLKASLGAPGLHTKRQHLHHLLAARSGHGDFAGCHERFNHEEARIECSCGGENHRHTPSTAGR
ncbi:RNase H domain-containing protein [Hirsutella rhossiliensis]